jgi:BirA family biotin operon repressor/biotin-[acetyl-CoA-carboxylase] ligase
MSFLKPILNLLADGQFHSAEEVSYFSKIPFHRLHETLQQILDPSIHLEKLDKKGYRIPGGLELLNEKLISNELGDTRQLLDHLEIVTSVNSTNTCLLEKPANCKKYAIFAEQQTSGRGQFNRPWLSGLGKNIALSLSWNLPNTNKLMSLSLIMGLAVIQALKEYGLNGIKLKWPNDVVYKRKKLAGILIETQVSKSKLSKVVIGIGLNLYKPIYEPNSIDQAITDVYTIYKLPPQRNRIAGLLLKNALMALSTLQANGPASFLKKWQKTDDLKDQLIYIQTPKAGTIEGIARGINAFGQLRVDIKGETHCFHSGEIRISLKS